MEEEEKKTIKLQHWLIVQVHEAIVSLAGLALAHLRRLSRSTTNSQCLDFYNRNSGDKRTLFYSKLLTTQAA